MSYRRNYTPSEIIPTSMSSKGSGKIVFPSNLLTKGMKRVKLTELSQDIEGMPVPVIYSANDEDIQELRQKTIKSARQGGYQPFNNETTKPIPVDQRTAIGRRFGKLTVTGSAYWDHSTSRRQKKLPCLCDCGADYTTSAKLLTGKQVTQCQACSKRDRQKQIDGVKINVGRKFGKWTVSGEMFFRQAGSREIKVVPCQCECGTRHDVLAYGLVEGKSVQCKKCVGRQCDQRKRLKAGKS